MAMRTVTAMGETIMDILFRQGQPVAAVPGGSSFNSIISIGRTGLPCRFIGYTGRDRVGLDTQAFLQKNGVSIDNFEVREGEKSAISLAFLDENGDATYQFYKDIPRAHKVWLMPEFHRDDVLLFGSYYAACDGMRPQVAPTLHAANEAGAILYYDINFRRSHLHELDALMPAIHENFRESTLVRGSADDFEVMYQSRDARDIYARHISKYSSLFICTAGGGTITICTPRATFDFQTPTLPNVVSTVGAGDNFNAGFIYGLLHEGITRDELPALNRDGWQRLVGYATRFAGEACQSTDNFVSTAFAERLNERS
ncbi:MAG: carbohydrate kinase [Bacteroidaceae bacterium]|nr:carbohydrate kinase [Bacteroidaceae bacterium]